MMSVGIIYHGDSFNPDSTREVIRHNSTTVFRDSGEESLKDALAGKEFLLYLTPQEIIEMGIQEPDKTRLL